MPTFEFAKQAPAAVTADAVVVFATKAGGDGRATPAPTADAAALAGNLGFELGGELQAVGFEGDLGAVARIPTRGAAEAAVVLVAGLGKADDVDLDGLRKAAGAAVRAASKDSSVAIVVPGDLALDADSEQIAQAITEGAGLGAYAFTAYRTKAPDSPSIERVRLLAGERIDAKALRSGMETGEIVVAATCVTRDLVNTPPADKRPPALAERISELARRADLRVTVHDERALEKGGFGGILGVGQGSSEPPRLVELVYDPARPGRKAPHIVLVGKGITFDSGGLSLKTSAGMSTMKSDMSGAAAVVGAMTALADLGVKVRVTGLVALAENMPSGTAIRVSDVLTHRGGKTVEVMNTDAEGRLVLADALAYGVEQQPEAIIDLATLTGAQIVALGPRVAGLMGSDDALVGDLGNAAEHAGERVWHMPLPTDYAEQLKSEVADLKNIGKANQAGMLIGGLFLKEFAGGLPWAHLDIAGPAFAEDGDGYYTPRGGTGAGVRTLLAFLRQRSAG